MFGLYGFGETLSFGMHRLSPQNLESLRARRTDVIAAISGEIKYMSDDPDFADRLKAGHESLPGYQTGPGAELASSIEPGFLLDTHNGFRHMMAIAIDLNAIEVLPELLELEELLYDEWLIEAEEMKDVHEIAYFRARPESVLPDFTQSLSAISALLRQERFKPLLESDWEADFKKALANPPAELNRARGVRPRAQISPVLMKHVFYDPIYGTAREFGAYVKIDLTPDNRDRLIGWANEFLASTAPENFRAEKGMSEWPVVR